MKYNIIGDIHGLTSWEKLVKKNHINIFVGDYFSPYSFLPFEAQMKNFLKIMKYKENNPNTTVLLIGNHDEDHWHIVERYSRHDSAHCNDIRQLFNEFKEYFQIAYNIEDKAVVSHAGITSFWYEVVTGEERREFDKVMIPKGIEGDTVQEAHRNYFKSMSDETFEGDADNMWNQRCDAIIDWNGNLYRYDKAKEEYSVIDYKVSDIVDTVNKLWLDGKYDCFNFRSNSDNFDSYGYSKTHGPLWVRDKTLVINNIFKYRNVKQFVGHTQHERILYIEKVGFADCLQFASQTLGYDSETDKVYRYEGKHKPVDITEEYK